MKSSTRILFLGFLFSLYCSVSFAQSSCSNVDFESGSLAGWKGYTGTCCPIAANTLGIVAGRHTIMTGPGFDPNVPTIPVVSPFGGTYSVKLGDDNVGSQAERLVFTFPVTAANPNFTYQYAVILEDPGHPAADQPRFQVNIKNQSGNLITCGAYNVVSSGNIPGFVTLNGIVYKDWSLVAVDLTAYIGQNITVEFQTGDCAQGGHYGYAYIDASCNPLQITSSYCPGDFNATLTAPPGFKAYQWSTGQTTQNISVSNPTPGDTIKVVCTPYQGANCATTLRYIFLQSPPVNAYFTVNTSCGNNQVVFTDSSTINSPGAQVNGWQWIVNNQIVGTGTPTTYSFPGAGNYNVTLVAQSNQGCPDTTTRQLSIPQGMSGVPSIPSTNIYNGYGTSCSGQANGIAYVTMSLGTPPYTYAWNTTPPSSNDSIFNLKDGVYVVTVTDQAGCVTTDTARITAPPSIVIAPVVQSVKCFGDVNGSIQLNATGGVGTLSYAWAHDPNLKTGTATGLTNNTYSFTITDINGCTFDSSLTVTAPAAPYNVVASPTDLNCFNVCNGSIALPTVTGNTAPYSFSWNTTPVQTTQTAVNLCAGTYTCTITDVNNCTTSVSASVTQPTQLTVALSKVDETCVGGPSSGSTNAVPAGGTPPYTYKWNTGPTTPDLTGIPAGTYTCTVTDSKLCTVSASITVNPPQPIITVSSHQNERCFGTSTGIVFTNTSGGLLPYSYQWSVAGQNQQNAVNLPAGTYSLTVTDSKSCTATITETITEPALLTAVISNSVNELCWGGNNGSATVSANGGSLPYVYNWDTNPVQNTATASSLIAGTYNVTVTDDSLCTASTTVTITEPTHLDIVETLTHAVCYDSTQGAISLNVSNGTPPYNYTWQPAVSNGNSAVNLLAGIYSVTVSDQNNCSFSNTFTINQPPQLGIAAQETDALCKGSTEGTITVSSLGGTPAYLHTLFLNGSPVTSNGTGLYTGLGAGAYTAQFTDANNCTISYPIIVNEPTQVVLDTFRVDSVNCYNYKDGKITALVSGGSPPYTYLLDTFAGRPGGTFTNLGPGTYVLRVLDSHNCEVTATGVVTQPDSLVVMPDPDSLVLILGETKPINVKTNFDPNATFAWNPWKGLDCTTCAEVNVTLYHHLDYTVQVTTHPHRLDCKASAVIPVTVIPNYDMYVPNAFTPNGDGVNDYFEVFGKRSAIKYIQMQIFNRIGEKVYDSNDLNFRWDGRFRGELQPPGVYVYQMQVVFMDNHSEPAYKGSLTLIR